MASGRGTFPGRGGLCLPGTMVDHVPPLGLGVCSLPSSGPRSCGEPGLRLVQAGANCPSPQGEAEPREAVLLEQVVRLLTPDGHLLGNFESRPYPAEGELCLSTSHHLRLRDLTEGPRPLAMGPSSSSSSSGICSVP